MHILSPLAIAAGACLAIMRNIAYLPDTSLMAALSAAEIYCLVSWLMTRANKSFFGIKTAGVIMCGLENLLVALAISGRGKASTCGNSMWMLEKSCPSDNRLKIENKKAPLEA